MTPMVEAVSRVRRVAGPCAPGSRGPDRQRMARILSVLKRAMPAHLVALQHRSPFELLVATILSAQCTDQRVNQVTPLLFRTWPRPRDYAHASPADLEAVIRPTGLFKAKARNLIACGRVLVGRFNGRVPQAMEPLLSLPGVGRKTANVLLGHAFGQPAIVVDTHVSRVSNRLGFVRHKHPDRIEQALQALIPSREWTPASQRLLLHGRYVCTARAPRCSRCPIYRECHWEGKGPA